VRDSLKNSRQGEIEAYSDFLHHTRELQKRVRVPVKLFISSSIVFASHELILADSQSFVYVFVRKGGEFPKVIQGVDSWTSLKEQADRYFKQKKQSSAENEGAERNE
jgi:hypothetical protein